MTVTMLITPATSLKRELNASSKFKLRINAKARIKVIVKIKIDTTFR